MTTNRNQPQLSEAQRQAAMLIATGMKAIDIAQQLGISEYTLSRWRQLPQFKAEINLLLNAASEGVVERLRGLAGKAVDALESVLDGDATASDKIKAATAVLGLVGLSADAPPVRLTAKLPVDLEVVSRQQVAEQARAIDEAEFAWFSDSFDWEEIKRLQEEQPLCSKPDPEKQKMIDSILREIESDNQMFDELSRRRAS